MSYPNQNDPELEAAEPPAQSQTDSDDTTSDQDEQVEVIFTDWAAF